MSKTPTTTWRKSGLPPFSPAPSASARRKDDEEWLHSAAVKQQMKRMDPKFNENALGYSTFSDLLKSRLKMVEVKEEGQSRMLRLR